MPNTDILLLKSIKTARKSVKLTQAEAAKSLGMCRDRYVNIEAGRGKLSIVELNKLLQLIDLQIVIVDKKLMYGN